MTILVLHFSSKTTPTPNFCFCFFRPYSPCTDIAPDSNYTCAQQKSFGKCTKPWMDGYWCVCGFAAADDAKYIGICKLMLLCGLWTAVKLASIAQHRAAINLGKSLATQTNFQSMPNSFNFLCCQVLRQFLSTIRIRVIFFFNLPLFF